jgi:hypothetical protein
VNEGKKNGEKMQTGLRKVRAATAMPVVYPVNPVHPVGLSCRKTSTIKVALGGKTC